MSTAAIVRVARAASSQDIAAQAAQDGAPHGTAVVVDVQTGGRGRRGRVWEAPAGALTLSVILRPSCPPGDIGWIPLATAVALREALDARLRIKWPNDLLLPDGRKVGGVLAEAEIVGGAVRHVIVGVGVNLVAAPPVDGAGALAALGPPPSHDAAVDAILAALLRWTAAQPDAIAAAWEAGWAHRGARLDVAGIHGIGLGLAEGGGLRLGLDDGRIHVVVAGDVTLVGAAPAVREAGC